MAQLTTDVTLSATIIAIIVTYFSNLLLRPPLIIFNLFGGEYLVLKCAQHVLSKDNSIDANERSTKREWQVIQPLNALLSTSRYERKKSVSKLLVL